MALADLGLNSRSKPYTWVFADATARNAAGSYVADDIGSFGLQLDTGELWRLTATTPTWQALATGLSNPMTAAGDLIVGDTGGAALRLALAGTNGHVLQRAAGAIAWGAVPSHNHAAGDVTSGTVATARLGSGTADATTFLRGDQSWATPAGGGGSLTTASTNLGSDVALATGGWTDVLSLSLAAGTWLVWGVLTANGSSTQQSTAARITDGTTTYAAANGTYSFWLALPAVSEPIVLGGTTTIKLQGYPEISGQSAKASGLSLVGTPSKVTHLRALKVA